MTREEALKVAKPILFNTEMVKAILDDRKTVTRRVIKPSQMKGIAPDRCPNHTPEEFVNEKPLLFKPYCDMSDEDFIRTIFKAPYQIGDILYVRETFAQVMVHGFWYRATPSKGCEKILWKPSIHMPKEAARIFLRITQVRAERLQEITANDIRQEGLTSACVHCGDMEIAKEEFALLWDSTIKRKDLDEYGWEADPWVWVYEFERLEVEG